LAALSATFSLLAQETRGSLIGRIMDQTGAVMPGVNVEVVHAETGVSSKTTTNQEGLYHLLYLVQGTYTLTATSTGFKTLVRQGIEIRINDRMELNLSMELGAAAERVQVIGETPLLETATASMGQVVDHRRIAELPLLHGNPMAVLDLTPGLAQARTADLGLWGGRVFDNGWTTSFQIDGSGSNKHEITLDGAADTTNLGGAGGGNRTVAFTPPADMVEEFKVQTASYDAGVGFTSGATINISVKPGTRDFHGTAYYFKIVPELNANQFFANRVGDPKVDFSYNRWGGSTTGPVYIPKIYKQRDKTFFAYGYEGHHDRPPWPETLTVPTTAERNGDFSALLPLGSRYQIYDPFSGHLMGGRVMRDPVPGNIIPSARISPMTKALTSYWAAPKAGAGAPDGSNNFPNPTEPDPNNYYSHVARVDHNVTASNRLYGRVAISKNIEKEYRDPYLNDASGNSLIRKNRGITLDDVHTFSPRVVLDVRYGYTRFIEQGYPKSSGFNPTKVGFSQALVSQLDPAAFVFPCFTFSDMGSLGCQNPSFNATDIHDLTGSTNIIHGTHNFKFGGAFRTYRYNRFAPGQGVPRLDFGNTYTLGPLDNSPSAPLGQGMASFLFGIPTGGNIDRNASYASQNLNEAWYLQDDWKIARKLTLTVGLRWEHEGAMTERYNRSVAGYDFISASPIQAQVKANYAQAPLPEIPVDKFNVIGGLTFAAVGANPRQVYQTPGSNWLPRVGLAWNVSSNTVVRAGYGIFFGFLGVQRGGPIQSGFSQGTSVIPSTDNGLTFRFSDLSNPWVDGLLSPTGSSLGLSTFLGRSISVYTQKEYPPYMQRWQASIQQQVPGRILLDLGYVGNRGTHVEISRNLDSIPLSYLSRSPVRDQATIDYMTTNFPNPFYPLLPGTGLAGTTVQRAALVTSYPHFTGLSASNFDGFSWYHSFQLKVERRFANSFTFQSSYTYSKMMEAIGFLNGWDPYPERVISSQDFPQRFSVSGIYELPFGRGKHWLGSARGIGGKLVSGWQAQGVYTGQSGQALGFGNAIFTGKLSDIPLPKDQRTVDQWFNVNAGFERNSSKALSYNFRTFNSRFSGVRADGINQFNLSLLKNTRFTESKVFQFRAEAINALNHVMFVNPNTTPTSSAFGTITDEKSTGRAIQLGFKFLF
jgi:hypothetical protein